MQSPQQGLGGRRMFSYRLVRLIALAAGVEQRVAGSQQVTHFSDISAQEL